LGGGKGLVEMTLNAKGVTGATSLVGVIGILSPINGSWVGFSQFLHFLNPATFPIWDSKIAELFGLNYPAQFNKAQVYREYAEYIHANLSTSPVKEASKLVEELKYYLPTDVRAAELLLFAGRP